MKNGAASILVVDDDEAKRYSITRLLKREGFKLREASTGAEALAEARLRPDLIVLDVKLPDMSGFEVCKRLRLDQATSRILILHMSATLVEARHRVAGLEGGADAYLTDATHPDEFLATVKALLRARDAERSLRETEERFEIMVRSVKEYAIYTCDSDGRITSWNQGVQRIFGYGRDEFLGKPFGIVFGSQADARKDLEAARAAGQMEYDRWHERGDGSRFFAAGILTAISNEAGEPAGFVHIVRDVTERRQADEERMALLAAERDARRDAERANRLKDEFLATLSHELRTPLTSILGWTQLLQSHRLPPDEFDEAVSIIERNARAQSQLIEDLLDVSRIISGKLRLAIEKINLTSLIEAAIGSVRAAAEARKIAVSSPHDPVDGEMLGDPARLQQVVWNLLSNAIKFTPEGGKVTVSLTRAEGEIEIVVADTGKGISPDFLPHVFERFRQADSSTSRAQTGLGLGLAIVRHLVELHGGTIRAESEGEGRGATFRVRLPIRPPIEPSTEDKSRLPNEAAGGSSAPPDLTGLIVLIVEDDADTRDLISKMLLQCGAQVDRAASAEEAVTLFERRRPNIIVSDIGMPGQDGYELMYRIRECEGLVANPVPAVALTAFAQLEDRRRALRAGFQVHVPKPVSPSALLGAVASLCGRVRN